MFPSVSKKFPSLKSGGPIEAIVERATSLSFSAFPSLTGFVKGGQVKLLVVNTAKRSHFAPNVPALGEMISGFDFAPNIGIFAPAKTPAAIVNRLADEVAKLVKEADVIQTFTTAGIEGIGGSPADYVRVLEREAERDAKAVKAAGVKVE